MAGSHSWLLIHHTLIDVLMDLLSGTLPEAQFDYVSSLSLCIDLALHHPRLDLGHQIVLATHAGLWYFNSDQAVTLSLLETVIRKLCLPRARCWGRGWVS